MIRTADFDYELPDALIAQRPAEPRDSCRLMVVERNSGRVSHRKFRDLPEYLRAGDCLVVNDTAVRRARLRARKADGGGRVEVLLLGEHGPASWEALVRPGKRLPPGTTIDFPGTGVSAEVGVVLDGGRRVVTFPETGDAQRLMGLAGELPIPPYVHRQPADLSDYQTVYADRPNSVAAPTAGLHFTRGLLDQIERAGVRVARMTLEIGVDTFRPVTEERVQDHEIHGERFSIDAETAAHVNQALAGGQRVIAVGTTVTRALESACSGNGQVAASDGTTELFILPGFVFRAVRAVVTNFHLPGSTPLMMVCAFAGMDLILDAYRQAVTEGYRFYSFGDAMLIV